MKMNLWFEPSRAQFDKRKYFVNFIYLYIYIYTLVSKEISRYFKTILLKIINSKLIHRVSDPLYRIDNSPRNYYTPRFIYYIYRLICYPIYRAKWKWILYAIKYFSRRKHHFIRNICLYRRWGKTGFFFFFKNQLFLFLGLLKILTPTNLETRFEWKVWSRSCSRGRDSIILFQDLIMHGKRSFSRVCLLD